MTLLPVDSRVGTRLFDYELTELIGRGGMGVVFRARDLTLERNVAVKLIAPEYASDPGFRHRFLAESKLAASLEHPNVLPVFAAGEYEGQLYLVTRLVEGRDFAALLASEQLPPARVLAIVSQIADALDAAHARGLVHRDVKPSNVLVDANDHAYLGDFGLAREISGPAASFPGASMATVGYIAPEQIRGDPVDGRADVYSLACVVYEGLYGAAPFAGKTDAAVLYAHLESDPPSPARLERVFARSLAKDPADRYGSCAEFIDDVRESLDLVPRQRPQRRRAMAAVAAAVALAAVAIAAGIVLTQGPAAAAATGGRLTAIDPAGDRVGGGVDIGGAPSAVAVGAGRVWTTSVADSRLWSIDPRTLSASSSPTSGTPLDLCVHRGLVYVSIDAHQSVQIVDPQSGASPIKTGLHDPPLLVPWSRGVWGVTVDRVYWIHQPDLFQYTVDSSLVAHIPSIDDEANARMDVNGAAFGNGMLWVTGDALDRRVWEIDPLKGRIVRTIRLAFAPDGVAVAGGSVWIAGQLDDHLHRIDAASGRIIASIPVGNEPTGVAAGAGAVWVANSVDGTVSRVNQRSGRVVDTVAVGGQPRAVAFGAGRVWVVGDAS